MKLLPPSIKKKLSRFMNWFDFGSAVILGAAAFFGGMAATISYDYIGGPGKTRENTVLQQKVTHLMQSYKMAMSLHLVIDAAGSGMKVGLDLPAARAEDRSLTQAFEAEAQATGIALAHARQISVNDRRKLYKQLEPIQPARDYFPKGGDNQDALLTVGFAQWRVMNRPGFTPTVETARDIVKGTRYGTPVLIAGILGPLALSLGGMFGFCAARKRLDQSIERDEAAVRKAEEEANKAEAARHAEEVQREAAEAAERERIAKLPPAVALDRDISVRQIRLAVKGQSPGV